MKKVLLFLCLFFISLNVSAQNDKVVYLSLKGSEKIIIDIENNLETKIISGELEKKITITNLSEYKSIFLGFDDNRYPTYITKTSDNYSFSKTKKSNSENYILLTQIHNLSTNISNDDISSCDKLFGYKFINLLKNNIFKIIYYIIPIILIVTSTLDFMKLVFSEDKEGVPGAFRRLLRRALVSVLIFLVPTILIFITNIFGSEEVKSCITTFKTTENISGSK